MLFCDDGLRLTCGFGLMLCCDNGPKKAAFFEWFDAVDLIRLTGKKHQNLNLITETTKRDRMFLENIGYYGELNHTAKA